MMDRESRELIKALAGSIQDGFARLVAERMNGIEAAKEAVELPARVLSLDDVRCGGAVWIEYAEGIPLPPVEGRFDGVTENGLYRFALPNMGTTCECPETYGESWRCWTRRPTMAEHGRWPWREHVEAPRVLAASEIPTHDGAVLMEYRDPEEPDEWALYRKIDGNGMVYSTSTVFDLRAPIEEYGQAWRCWTGRPTEAQRAATGWKARAARPDGSRERAEKLMRELSDLGNALMKLTRETAGILRAIDEGEDD